MNKALKWTLIASTILVGGGIVYWQIKKYKVPAKKKIPIVKDVSTDGQTVLNTSGCGFPLQKGSNNDCVSQLQDALGVTIDGKFGPITLAALQEQVGLSSIQNAVMLEQVIDQIIAQDELPENVSVNLSASNQILAWYYPNGQSTVFGTPAVSTQFKYIRTLKATNWLEVTYNTNTGNYEMAGFQISLPAFKNMSLSDYKPKTVDSNDGKLIIECTSGVNKGLWKANPQDIELF